MRNDNDITNRRLVRRARTPAQGTPLGGTTGGHLNVTPPNQDAKVMDDNSVRRLWTPGDPWSNGFYFGGSGE